MNLVSTFSERLKKILEIRDIKPSKFAEMVGINKSTISQYLNGEYEPKRNRIELFAKILNVNEAWLIGYDVVMRRENNIDEKNEALNEVKQSPRFRWVARNAKKMTDDDLLKLQNLMKAAFEKIDFDEDNNEEE